MYIVPEATTVYCLDRMQKSCGHTTVYTGLLQHGPTGSNDDEVLIARRKAWQPLRASEIFEMISIFKSRIKNITTKHYTKN